jgi:hypothetical protein
LYRRLGGPQGRSTNKKRIKENNKTKVSKLIN